ncbi:MAG: hypothetical protein KGH84_03925 [Paracoccaceae bacterium]|nr:hypothetical protein [Paracoccaceae bacterium]
MRKPTAPALVLASLLLAAAPAGAVNLAPPLSAVAQLGKKLFFDPALSGSGAMSCAFCHDPANHFAPSNDLAVQLGGPGMNQPGIRATPSIAYKSLTPAFTMAPSNPVSEADEATPMAISQISDVTKDSATGASAQRLATKAAGPKKGDTSGALVARGGLFWDGRADTLEEQALGPLLSPFEMANKDRHSLYRTIRKGYSAEIAQLFGAPVLADETQTLDEAAFALARYQVEDRAFQPFSSKYDAYLAGKAQLSPAEARGLKLFDDPKKGNCAACHLDTPSRDGHPPLFTDFEFEALGVPRNPALPANADAAFFDLGLCGPLRHDSFASQAANCGLFKTPTLRNVATRHVFFHNGVYTKLTDAIRFYVLRDTQPNKIYPTGHAFDDLPARYRGNIDRVDAPLDRHLGDKPALNEVEIADVAAFLQPLTDGYTR